MLRSILERVETDLESWKGREPAAALEAKIALLPPTRDFGAALRRGFGMIAEIKKKSPSLGEMRNRDTPAIAAIYERSATVQAVSVLTNAADFGMSILDLAKVRALVSKPILRKDFIFDPYQVLQARAYGADAILLMANVVTEKGLRELSAQAEALGLAVLFESHEAVDMRKLPADAKICGINSRRFMAGNGKSRLSSLMSRLVKKDLSIDLSHFRMVQDLPPGALKVAESGVNPSLIPRLRDELGFNSVLVGTSILMAPQGVEAAMAEFEKAIHGNSLAGAEPQLPLPAGSAKAA